MRICGFDLERLIRIVEASEIDELQLGRFGSNIKITKAKDAIIRTCYLPELEPPKNEKPKLKYEDITSPGVGEFHIINPETGKPYVKKGQEIKKGGVVGHLKHFGNLTSPIESELDGKVDKFYVKHNQPVEYKQPLFKIRVKH